MVSGKQQRLKKARKKFGRNQQILGSLRAGWSARKIATEYSISYSWAKKLCKRLKNGGKGERKSGSGRPRKTTIREDRYLIREALRKRDSSEACPTTEDLGTSLKERTSTQVSQWTVRRRLHERNIKKCVKTKKPFVSPTNLRKRIEFARQYRHWSLEQWKKVLWSDESPYHLRFKNRQYVWRSGSEKFLPRCLQGTVKHEKKVMVWGCFSWNGVGSLYRVKGIMKKEQYRQILIHHMRPSASRLHGNDYIFQHDNDPKHTSNVIKNYLQNQGIEVLPWPAQSPDLNPIENLWSEIDRQLEKRESNSEDELFECLKETWEALSVDYIHKLVESMPKRCAEVLKNRRYPIDY